MKKYLPVLIITALVTSLQTVARVHDFETTRLKSTAGTGVASILLNESAVLNPANISFFDFSTGYFQMERGESSNSLSENSETNRSTFESDGMGVILAETGGKVSGALSYQKQTEGENERKRFSAALAQPAGKRSSFGAIYRYTDDIEGRNESGERPKNKFHQLVFGATHAISPNFTVGVVVIDPLKSNSVDSKALVGLQFVTQDILSLMVDAGSNYTSNDLEGSSLVRGAIQVNFLADLYVRAGIFNDKSIMERGSGYGLSWIGPRLALDFAMKNSKSTSDDSPLLSRGESLQETSMSLTYQF